MELCHNDFTHSAEIRQDLFLTLCTLVSEPNLKLRSRLKQKQERRNSPLMTRKTAHSPCSDMLNERIRRKLSSTSTPGMNRKCMPSMLIIMIKIRRLFHNDSSLLQIIKTNTHKRMIRVLLLLLPTCMMTFLPVTIP